MKPKIIYENVLQGNRPPVLHTDEWNPKWSQFVNLCWNQNPDKRPTFKQMVRWLPNLTIPAQ